MKKKKTLTARRKARSAPLICSAIVVNLKLWGTRSNCKQVERGILEAVRSAVEDAASSSFTGEGKVEVEWTGTLR